MTISKEELAAFADGQLDPERESKVAAAVSADPALAEQVKNHRVLKAALSSHYAPIADEPVPARLAAMLAPQRDGDVVDFAAAKERRDERHRIPRWGWIAGPALAASLALAVFLPQGSEQPSPYADTQLAAVLDDTLVAQQPRDADTRILLSFRNDADRYCRAFTGVGGGGIACRDDNGWELEAMGEGIEAASTEYRMAGAADGEILVRAQEMAVGSALDAEEEARARRAGWR